MKDTRYAIIVQGKEVKADNGNLMTREGDRFWVLREPQGWVSATSTRFKGYENVPSDILTFESEAAAKEFASKWNGHPWYCRPYKRKGLEIVPVQVRTRVVFDGYELRKETT